MSERVRSIEGAAGIAGASLFTVGWFAGGFAQAPSYSWSKQEISDLGSITARHAWVWNLSDSLSGALIAVFAFALFQYMGPNRPGRLCALLVGIIGVGGMFDGVLREDCPLSTSAACQRLRDGPGLSWHHQAHDVESVLVGLAVLAAPFAMAKALSALRAYCLLTGITMVAATALYVALYGQQGGGIAQRFIAVMLMSWVAVLGIWILDRTPSTEVSSRISNRS
jgi:hypothetical membrane protein